MMPFWDEVLIRLFLLQERFDIFLDEINSIHHSRFKIRGYSYNHILFLININHIAAVTKGQVNPCFLVHDPPKISIIQSLIAVVFNSHGCCHLFNPTR